jgi:hypothetical protein
VFEGGDIIVGQEFGEPVAAIERQDRIELLSTTQDRSVVGRWHDIMFQWMNLSRFAEYGANPLGSSRQRTAATRQMA